MREETHGPMTLDAFRAEAAGWLGRDADAFACVAWKHEPGRAPERCPLGDAEALSVPRAEYDAARDDAAARSAPAWAATPEAEGTPCTVGEMAVVYALAQKLLGFTGAVVASPSGRSWTVFRDA